MEHLFLDTNILLQEGLYSGPMTTLSRLAKHKYVTIHLSELVKREFTSKQIANKKAKLTDAKNSLKSVTKQLNSENTIKTTSEMLEREISDLADSVEKNILEDFEKWSESVHLNTIAFRADAISNVLDDYFSGEGVYKKAKNREDIPDAMINESINDLIREHGAISTLIKDGAFRNHLKNNPNINTFNSVQEYLNTPSTQAYLTEIDSNYKTLDIIQSLLSDEFRDHLANYLTTDPEITKYIFIDTDDISNTKDLGTGSWGEQIQHIFANTIQGVEITGVAFLNNNKYGLDIEFITKGKISYAVDYHDFLYLDEDTNRHVELDSMKGDGRCSVSELTWMTLFTYIELTINDDADAKISVLKDSACPLQEEPYFSQIAVTETKAHLHIK